MKFITTYLRPYRKIFVFVLVLAAINQVFSLMSPQVLRRLIDNYLTKVTTVDFTTQQYIRGILL